MSPTYLLVLFLSTVVLAIPSNYNHQKFEKPSPQLKPPTEKPTLLKTPILPPILNKSPPTHKPSPLYGLHGVPPIDRSWKNVIHAEDPLEHKPPTEKPTLHKMTPLLPPILEKSPPMHKPSPLYGIHAGETPKTKLWEKYGLDVEDTHKRKPPTEKPTLQKMAPLLPPILEKSPPMHKPSPLYGLHAGEPAPKHDRSSKNSVHAEYPPEQKPPTGKPTLHKTSPLLPPILEKSPPMQKPSPLNGLHA